MNNKKKLGLFILLVLSIFVSGQLILAGNLPAGADDDEMKCVVCNSVVAKDAVTHTSVYKGNTYYFANSKCHAEFEKNPGKYAFEVETFYSCPMHSEEKSAKEGTCSKCGMALKKHEHKSYYVCPMSQCNVRTDEPGKCPNCGMDLKKVTEAGACCKTGKK